MRKLIYAINLSLDGCCDHSKMSGTKEILGYHANLLQNVDTFVYGRKTWQLMVPYWPDIAKNHAGQTEAEIEFAQAFDSVAKIVVFSQSLNKAEGNKTKIVSTDLQGEIFKLKKEQGKNILTGGVNIPSQLIQLGLVDEFHVVIQPIFVGEGLRLLESVNLKDKLQLKLAESKIFDSGCVALRYLK